MEIKAAIEKSIWLRLTVLFIAALIITIIFMPEEARQPTINFFAGLLGYATPAIVAGAIAGWIWYSRKAFAWTAGVVLIMTIAALLTHPQP